MFVDSCDILDSILGTPFTKYNLFPLEMIIFYTEIFMRKVDLRSFFHDFTSEITNQLKIVQIEQLFKLQFHC